MICLHHLASSSKSQTPYPFRQPALLPKPFPTAQAVVPQLQAHSLQALSTQIR